MSARMKRFVVIVGTVAALVAAALPASAHLTDVQASPRARMFHNPDQIRIAGRGTTVCSPGEYLALEEGRLRQGDIVVTGKESDPQPCPEGTTTFFSEFIFEGTGAFHVGYARLSYHAVFSDGQDFRYSRQVRIVEG